MESKNKAFSYTYSASQQEEVKRIRQKYLPSETDKMELLRRLDERATRPGKIAAFTTGLISSLVLGVGMCCTMVWTQYFILGIIIGVIGIAGVCATYPLFVILTKQERKKLAPEIIRLSEELMGTNSAESTSGSS